MWFAFFGLRGVVGPGGWQAGGRLVVCAWCGNVSGRLWLWLVCVWGWENAWGYGAMGSWAMFVVVVVVDVPTALWLLVVGLTERGHCRGNADRMGKMVVGKRR